MQDFSLIFTADLKHVTMVFSKILPQNQLNSDTDLSVQRKPIFGSSLFGIASFDTIRRNWESLRSLETIFNCGNFICKYYWMFLIFSGCFQQRYTNYSITSKNFEIFVFFMVISTNHCWWKGSARIAAWSPCFPHLEIHMGILWLSSGWAQSFCLCFMIRQYCKMETKVKLDSPTFLFSKVQPA